MPGLLKRDHEGSPDPADEKMNTESASDNSLTIHFRELELHFSRIDELFRKFSERLEQSSIILKELCKRIEANRCRCDGRCPRYRHASKRSSKNNKKRIANRTAQNGIPRLSE